MGTTAARFTARWTQAQKDALLHAVCIEKVTVAEAVRMAHRGDLPCGPFAIDRQYAYQVVKNERESFENRHPEALRIAVDDAIRGLAAKAVKQARLLEKSDWLEPDELKRTIAALKAAQSGLAKPEKPAAKQPPATGEKPAAGGDVLSALLDKAQNAEDPR